MSDSEGKRLFQELSLLAMEAYKRGETKTAAELLEKAHEVRARLSGKRTHLHPSRKVSTLPPMDAVTPSRGAAISAAKTKANTRFQQLLQEHGLSIPEWVEAQEKKTRPSVEQARSWCKPRGKGGRAVPRAWAERLASQFEAPELLADESWPCGIR